jgi:hypothetical protein
LCHPFGLGFARAYEIVRQASASEPVSPQNLDGAGIQVDDTVRAALGWSVNEFRALTPWCGPDQPSGAPEAILVEVDAQTRFSSFVPLS